MTVSRGMLRLHWYRIDLDVPNVDGLTYDEAIRILTHGLEVHHRLLDDEGAAMLRRRISRELWGS